MFNQPKNIETAFQHIRTFSLVWLVCCGGICFYCLYYSFKIVNQAERKVYILSSGKVMEAFAAERHENLAVEARDHIRTFHQYFFSLDPDEKVINTNITKALYLADASAKRLYDNLKENGYYAGIISGNISQQVAVDSVDVRLGSYPYYFRWWGRQIIIRPTSIVTRSLVTEGWMRNVNRSDNNPHGFLIEKWNTLENKDVKVEMR